MSIENDNSAQTQGEALSSKTYRLLDNQLDLSLGLSGLIGSDTAEAIYSLACAYRELSKDEE